jgi:alginate O-acetyltransferase complex protein AlgI
MVFSSPMFLFMFLPIVLAAYYLSPKKFQNLILTLASLYFYSFGEKYLVLVMLLSIVVDYYCAILIDNGKKKLGIYISVFSNLSILGFFKYFNFTFENFNLLLEYCNIHSATLSHLPHIALPIGISFYIFQTLSYTIDVYRGDVKANRNFIEFATFVTMFQQLVAGPIVRYIDIQNQIHNKDISILNFKIGMERFIVGLIKKLVIANTFARVADEIFKNDIDYLSTSFAWIGIISYTIQIYFDFSGYSDMAIGLGRMFGFDFLENFNYPYTSTSIKDFWRRWHISLSTWFRDYLYIPLGGNKMGSSRTYINLTIVFFATGLWHGASWNFVFWGMYHGLFIVIERVGFEKILDKLWKPIQHIYTLFVVIIGWVFFRSDTLDYAFKYLNKMFVFNNGNETLNSYLNFFDINNEFYFILLIAILFSMPVYKYIDAILSRKQATIARPLVFISLLFISIIYLAADTYNPFIYFKF